MNTLIKLWNQISYIGLGDSYNYLANRRIILCNQLCALVVIDTLFYLFLLVAFNIHSLVAIHTACIGLYFFVFWLNKNGFFTTAKYVMLLTVCLEVFLGSMLLDARASVYLYYFPIICASLVIFDYREQAKSLIILLVILVSLIIIHWPYAEVSWKIAMSPFVVNVLFYSTLATSSLITLLCVFHLIKANYHVEKEMTMACSSEEELNRELVTREEELNAHLEHLSKLTSEIDSEKAKLSAIVENTNHFIWSVDRDYKLVYFNTRYCKLMYYRFGVEVKAGDDVIAFLPEPIATRWKPFYDRALAGEKFSVELPGENFYKELFLNPIIDKNKQITGVTVFMQNINDRKEAEIQLIAAKEMAEQTNRVKSDFLSNMSHEIRTPMNAVIGLSSLLLEQNPRPDQVELLQVLRFSSENLLSLINDILDLQKIEAGKMVFEEADFLLQDLLNNIIYAFNLKAADKGLELSYRVDENVPSILSGDSVRLTQILNNLLSNAIKFTDTGSVQIQVNLEENTGERCVLCFSVKDTGIGIDKAKLEKIFQAFEQAEINTTRKYGGTGLGLAITKKLIELQKGHIQVESIEGIGSRFYFTLPFKKGYSAATRTIAGSTVQKPDLGYIQMLLVEDNQVNIMVAQKFLQRWKIKPDLAENGEEALQKAQQKKFDIILMDLQMPVMNGLEASRVIRNMAGINKHTPIIALTADVSADVKERAMQAGMNHYLAKPFHEKDLYQTLVTYTSPVAEHNAGIRNKDEVSINGDSKEINYQQINRLAEGDKQFMNELLAACLDNLSELQVSYTLSMKSKDVDSLRQSIHKFKSILHLLKLSNLQHLLERSKQVLQGSYTAEDVCLLISETEEECKRVKEELCKYGATYDCAFSD